MTKIFDTLLLLALPASGKSEVRTFLSSISPEAFHMGPTVQLDDYPYVHMQLVVDEVLEDAGLPRVFHVRGDEARNGPFIDGRELGALGWLLSQDYDELLAGQAERPERAAERLLERFDQASVAVGAAAKLDKIPAEVMDKLITRLEPEAREFFDAKADGCPSSLDGKTVVIEFARGASEGCAMPATGGYGYAGTLPCLSPTLLQRAAILYVWVTPEESRRKNRARARPDGDSSILFHGVPEQVMRQEYGSCDLAYLMETSGVAGTVKVSSQNQVFHVPVARFDNRKDLTSFIHADRSEWKDEDIEAMRSGMKEACDRLWDAWKK